MRIIVKVSMLLGVLFCLIFAFSGYCQAGETEAEDLILNVALYPLVPDMDGFEKAVEENWERLHPDVSLNFAEWDCYDEVPADDLDVFVFDVIYLSEFAEQGYLLPIPEEAVDAPEDLIPFAVDGCRNDDELYAVPQLLCTNLLYTRKEDKELAGVSDIETLYEILGSRVSQTEIPGENEGLLIDMTGGTTKVCMCLDAMMDFNQKYTDYQELPDPYSLPDDSLDALRMLVDMGGDDQVRYWPEDNELYVRGRWFSEGIGRAYIGYTEAMSAMGACAEDVDFCLFSYAPEDNIPLYFADVAAVNSGIEESKKELAYDLVNVLTGEAVMISAVCPGEDVSSWQYLLPARYSLYDRLAESNPVYERLRDIVSDPDSRLFRLGEGAREFVAKTKKILPDLVFLPEEASLAA